MTIYLPEYARSKSGYFFWKKKRQLKAYLHGLRRNPDCNERRRYRDDVGMFVSGPHEHVKSTGGFDIVRIPFAPLRFDGPTYRNGLKMSYSDGKLHVE